MEWAEAFAVGMAAVILVLLILCLIAYVFESLVKMKIFKLFGTCSPVIAWIPFVSQYFLGRTCNGKDGGNIGIFGMRFQNVLYNFWWLIAPLLAGVAGVVQGIIGESFDIMKFVSMFITAMNLYYWSSIYAFIYSRVEGKTEPEVRVISIVSAVIGFIGYIKILTIGTNQVYSLENDVFPVEQGGVVY